MVSTVIRTMADAIYSSLVCECVFAKLWILKSMDQTFSNWLTLSLLKILLSGGVES